MKNGAATGNDHINIETLKEGEDTISKTLAKLYTKCLSKKTNTHSMEERYYLLSNTYKVLTKVLTKRLQKTLDENQPREQAGFRSRYSTTDHIHVVNQLKEKCREYNISPCIAFVDYEKAFDSMQTQAVHNSRDR